MRILAIGLGGAGSRIIDKLLEHDRMSAIHCVEGLAADSDADELASLEMVPADRRLFFSPLDPSQPDDIAAHLPKEEILSHLQAMDDGDIDALVLCCGLGGTHASVAPDLVSFLKKSLVEPVFGLCTLPRGSEGDLCLARALDQLDMLLATLDGIIVFDNEAWKEKVPAITEPETALDADAIAGKLLEKLRPDIPRKPVDPFHEAMDTLIARRLSLLLRAGECSMREPDNLPEVVLDAGEILNTIQGMGLLTIGYAREELPPARPLDHILRFGPHTRSVRECHVKASRVVDLAKRAVFQEISADTDLSQVKKALVLIAGPSHEMSMKGFMTVRRWLDRSIQGLELRSGDYPVKETRYLGVLVILAGMETLPRIGELRRTRERLQEENGTKKV
ncbi:MAG: tubulin/FtsZ family protein [Methanolinea sp.]|jgi:cell division GTPase FtsZ|nr:tubulin/FtsZ family protein [Methanolinea sp.]